MSDKVKPWHQRRPKHEDKRKKAAGSDQKLVPLQTSESMSEESDYDPSDYSERWES